MKRTTLRLIAAACLALAVAGCGSSAAQNNASAPAAATESLSPQSAAVTPFGSTKAWPDGLTVSVSIPRSVQPSDSAYPKAARAAVFDVVIQNGTTTPFQSSLVIVQATAGGEPLAQIADSAQGLPTSSGTTRTVPPGGTIRLTVGFAVQVKPLPLVLTVQRDPGNRGSGWSFSGIA